MSGARLLLAVLLLSTACSEQAPPFFASDSYPKSLSEWELFVHEPGALALGPGTHPYELVTPLFSDYALKLRTIRVPASASANYSETEVFDFPVGTVISKTFYYRKSHEPGTVIKTAQRDFGFDGERLQLESVRMVETRLLVRQESGWEALPYVWNAEQTEATLQITGALQRMTLLKEADSDLNAEDFVYAVPNRNECANCHAVDQNDARIQPIGPAARNLDRPLNYALLSAESQLAHWQEAGLLEGTGETASRPAAMRPESTESLARNYLDINCGHCHQPGGSADTSGLFLNSAETSLARLGVCKPPVAAGRGTGGHLFSITPGSPETSILSFRMQSRELDIQMPELGRNLVHEEGVELVNRWISQLQGECLDPAG